MATVNSGSESESPDEDPLELPEEASYWCASCGEEIVIPVDLSAGTAQDYVEDCPVCCHPNRIQWTFAEDSGLQVDSETD